MQWTESILVDRPDTQVFMAISDLHEVCNWSAWVVLAGGNCSVVGDGTSFGSQLILRDKRGVERGHLRLVAARLGCVEFQVLSGAPGRRAMDVDLSYRLQDVGASATIVMLDLSAHLRLPAGMSYFAEPRLRRELRGTHSRELRGLKAYVEGQQLGR
jgi:hypothetical protein